VQCMADEAGSELSQYVDEGGLLLVIGEAGTRTMLGEPRKKGVLDDLFGITWRDESRICPVLDIRSQFLTNKLPKRCVLSGKGRLVRSETADVLAEGSYIPGGGKKNWGPQGLLRPEPATAVSGGAILARDVGKGQAVYIVPNIAYDYAHCGPRQRSREVIGCLLLNRLSVPFSTDAPSNVVITLWRQGNRRVFHLLNVPDSLLLLCGDVCPPHTLPEDFAPTGSIHITLDGRARKVFSPTGAILDVEQRNGRIDICLERLEQHEIIVIEG